MKKSIVLVSSLLVASSLLIACSPKKKTPPSRSASNSSKVIQTTTTKAPTSTTQPLTTSQQKASGMDIHALANGDYSSIEGTWRNRAGYTLTFDKNGLVSDTHQLRGKGKLDQGILQLDVGGKGNVGSGFVLLVIPAGTTIPQSHFGQGSDQTDKSRDRLVGTQNALTEYIDPYYKVSQEAPKVEEDPLTKEDTGVRLTSGQETIDYINAVFAEQSEWVVLEDNYSRANGMPSNLLQRQSDEALYRVFRNGVITDADYQIVYKPY